MKHSRIATMEKRPFQVVFASLLLLANAACQAETGKRDTAAVSADPAYGDTIAIKGHYVMGEETSAFYPCDGSRAQCAAAPWHGADNCWVQFTPNLHQQVSAKVAGYGPEGGRFWVEGMGGMSTRPGRYGHLGAHSCQIEISRIAVFETQPPVQSDD